MSLKTPDNIRNLQKKLYLKAKTEPDFRFYLLYDDPIFCGTPIGWRKPTWARREWTG